MRHEMKFLAFTLLFAFISLTTVSAGNYLIWNPSDEDQAEDMYALLVEQGYAGLITHDISDYLDQLQSYRPLIFFVDNSEDPGVQQTLIDIQNDLGDYLDAGGALYWDGVYTAFFNNFYRDQIFGFDIATCNVEPFTTIYGTSEFFETLTFSTDTTTAPMIGGGDGCAFAAIDICPDKAVFRDGRFRAILAAFPFGCLTDDGPHNRTDFINAVMGWLTGPVDIPEEHEPLPGKITYIQAYPNPFNVQTRIDFSVPRPDYITVNIYNLLGQPVETLFEGRIEAGEQSLYWNAETYSTGIYFARLEAVGYSECTKLILLK